MYDNLANVDNLNKEIYENMEKLSRRNCWFEELIFDRSHKLIFYFIVR